MQHSPQLGWEDAARKAHLGSSDLTSNTGKNTVIQLFFSVNSFSQPLGSESLQQDATLPGWKGLDLGLIPKCDSNQIAFGAADTQKSQLGLQRLQNMERDGKPSQFQTENKHKPYLRQGADWNSTGPFSSSGWDWKWPPGKQIPVPQAQKMFGNGLLGAPH